jgi:hypothetical protein
MSPQAIGSGIFKKTAKVNPSTRVPELLNILRTETNDRKREDAAEELRNYDTKAFAEIVPVLVDLALNDPKAGVRLEAVESLGKIRPITQQAGWALEQVIDKDNSMRVRLRARSLIVQYYLAGYRSGQNPETGFPKGIKTEEPPLADGVEFPFSVGAPAPGNAGPLEPRMPQAQALPMPPIDPMKK